MLNNRRLRGGFLLATLLLAAATPARAQRPLTLQTDAEQAAEDKIRERLKTLVTAKFVEQPLTRVVQQLAGQADLAVQIDERALEDASVGPDMPVTYSARDISLRSALQTLLGKIDLTFVPRLEAILVTTPEKAGNMLVVKAYPVYDLVTAGKINRRPGTYQHNYQQLIDLITSSIAPTTWDEVGGPGSIREFRPSGCLIIGQTHLVHEEIEELLSLLRRARDQQHIPHETPLARSGGPKPAIGRKAGAAAIRSIVPATVLMAPNVYD